MAARKRAKVANERGASARKGPRGPSAGKRPLARKTKPAAAPIAQRDARAVLARLHDAIPEPRCELRHQNAWQLLVATILSAQSTDARVNMVTPELFAAYPTPAALARAELADVERLVKSTGFFRNKAKAIVGASKIVADEHGGEVPRSFDALLRLPGVARKTANVVLGTAYRMPTGIVVDTHAGRVARRLGLTAHEDPTDVEADLCVLVPESDWVDTGHRLVLHGRYVCRALKPACRVCPLAELCPSRQGDQDGTIAERTRAERVLIASVIG